MRPGQWLAEGRRQGWWARTEARQWNFTRQRHLRCAAAAAPHPSNTALWAPQQHNPRATGPTPCPCALDCERVAIMFQQSAASSIKCGGRLPERAAAPGPDRAGRLGKHTPLVSRISQPAPSGVLLARSAPCRSCNTATHNTCAQCACLPMCAAGNAARIPPPHVHCKLT